MYKNVNKMENNSEVKKIRLMRVKNLPSSNQYYTIPFNQGEVVEYLGAIDKKEDQAETYRAQFVRLYRMKTKETRVEMKKDFEIIGKWEFDA